MTRPLPNKWPQFLVGALVIVTALSAYRTFGDKRPGPPQTPNAAADVRPVPVTATPPVQASAAGPSGRPPVAPSARLQSMPVTPPTRAREAVGRDNPFAPLVVPQRSFAQLGTPQSPSHPSTSVLGIDLPLPPGGAASRGQSALPQPPGAGMKVGVIVSGSERVAVIEDGGKIFIASVGDRVGDAAVVQILKDKVVMHRGGVRFELPFEGEGS
jgi:hypothetical protein